VPAQDLAELMSTLWIVLALGLGGTMISGPGSEPVLSSISSGTPGSTTATITWTSDVLSTSQVCSQATDVAHETRSTLNSTPVSKLETGAVWQD
jgi:hypothetical protein